MSITTTTVDGTVPVPPHLRRVLDGLDGLIARAEAARARWVANQEAGDRRFATVAALLGVRLARLRGSRAAMLADCGRRRGVAIAGEVPPVADDALP